MNLKQMLTQIANARADALHMMESEGFVFRVAPRTENLNERERWELLAFTLYTRLGQASATAEEALAALDEAKVSDEEWQRRHS